MFECDKGPFSGVNRFSNAGKYICEGNPGRVISYTQSEQISAFAYEDGQFSLLVYFSGNALAVQANGGKDTPGCHAVGGALFGAVWANHLKMPRLFLYLGVGGAVTMYYMKVSGAFSSIVSSPSSTRKYRHLYQTI